MIWNHIDTILHKLNYFESFLWCIPPLWQDFVIVTAKEHFLDIKPELLEKMSKWAECLAWMLYLGGAYSIWCRSYIQFILGSELCLCSAAAVLSNGKGLDKPLEFELTPKAGRWWADNSCFARGHPSLVIWNCSYHYCEYHAIPILWILYTLKQINTHSWKYDNLLSGL